MRRLPVIATIREAYVFTFNHLGAIIGLIWLPMVIVTVAGFFVSQRYSIDFKAAVTTNNAAAMSPATLIIVIFFLLGSLVLNAMMYVPVTQLALGQRQGGAMVHFAFGLLEWRLFRIFFGLALFLLPLVAMAAAAGQAVSAGVSGAIGQMMAAELLLMLLLCAVVYVFIRIAALLFPLAVAEEGKIVIRGWTLTRGNFWRLLAVLAGVTAPVLLATLFLQLLLDPGVAMMGGAAAGATAPAEDLPLAMGLQFLMAPFQIGLIVAASVFSWRALSKTDIIA